MFYNNFTFVVERKPGQTKSLKKCLLLLDNNLPSHLLEDQLKDGPDKDGSMFVMIILQLYPP